MRWSFIKYDGNPQYAKFNGYKHYIIYYAAVRVQTLNSSFIYYKMVNY